MTTKESICIKCNCLAYADAACCTENGKRSLISSCDWGGRNAGNRKTCKNFEKADDDMIKHRLDILEGIYDKKEIH